MSQTAQAVLGEVLRRARESLNRSPEQVGPLVGISGRTVRRLEAGEADRPRRVTLEALAGFYGLNPDVIVALAEADGEDSQARLEYLRGAVSDALGPGVVAALEGVDDEEVELAMRLARLTGIRADEMSPDRARAQSVISFLRNAAERSPKDHAEAVEAFVDFLSLDAGRRGLARQLLRDLRVAQDAQGASQSASEPGTTAR